MNKFLTLLLIFCSFLIFGRGTVTPSSANAGETLDVMITDPSAIFSQGSLSIDTEFSLYGSVNSRTVINDTTLIMNISVLNNVWKGGYRINVNNYLIGFGSYNTYVFFINGETAPYIKSIDPDTVVAAENLNVTITGSGTRFTSGSTTVSISNWGQGSTTINSINVVHDSSMVVNYSFPPNTKTGQYTLNVYDSRGGNLNKALYVHGIYPRIVSINPDTVVAGETLQVTITGADTKFTMGSTTVSLEGYYQGSATVSNIQVINDHSLTVDIRYPEHIQSGNFPVTVRNSYLGSIYGLIHVKGIDPRIVSVSPDTIQAGTVLDVTITGHDTHFTQGSTAVNPKLFGQGSVTVLSHSILSDTEMSVKLMVDSNSLTGTSRIYIYNSIDNQLTASIYVVGKAVPTVDPIIPMVAKPGDTLSVTITGSGTKFSQGSLTITSSAFAQGSNSVVSYTVINDSTLVISFSVASGLYSGTYDINIFSSFDGYMQTRIKIEGEDAVSVKETGSSFDFNVFPNPASSILNVQLGTPLEGTIIKILNQFGQLVNSPKPTSEVISIDVSAYARGLYYVVIKSAEVNVSEKVILK